MFRLMFSLFIKFRVLQKSFRFGTGAGSSVVCAEALSMPCSGRQASSELSFGHPDVSATAV